MPVKSVLMAIGEGAMRHRERLEERERHFLNNGKRKTRSGVVLAADNMQKQQDGRVRKKHMFLLWRIRLGGVARSAEVGMLFAFIILAKRTMRSVEWWSEDVL